MWRCISRVSFATAAAAAVELCRRRWAAGGGGALQLALPLARLHSSTLRRRERCCCRRRVFTDASASLAMRSSRALIIDTDCALDDLATLAMVAATETPLQLVTTVNGLAPPGHGHELVRQHGQSASLGSAPARLLRLLGARLPALVSSAPPRKKPVHPAPSHCPGCSSEPPPKPPIAPHLTIQVRRMLDALEMRSVPAVA